MSDTPTGKKKPVEEQKLGSEAADDTSNKNNKRYEPDGRFEKFASTSALVEQDMSYAPINLCRHIKPTVVLSPHALPTMQVPASGDAPLLHTDKDWYNLQRQTPANNITAFHFSQLKKTKTYEIYNEKNAGKISQRPETLARKLCLCAKQLWAIPTHPCPLHPAALPSSPSWHLPAFRIAPTHLSHSFVF